MRVTDPELDALEDVLTVWLLCDHHVLRSEKAGPVQIAGWQYGCKKCYAMLQRRNRRALQLWSKLVRQYDSASMTNARSRKHVAEPSSLSEILGKLGPSREAGTTLQRKVRREWAPRPDRR